MSDPGESRDYDHLMSEHRHALAEIARLRVEVRVLQAELEGVRARLAYSGEPAS